MSSDELKGKWTTLKKWQQNKLIHYAVNKNWPTYWYLKEIFLWKNSHDRDKEERTVGSGNHTLINNKTKY